MYEFWNNTSWARVWRKLVGRYPCSIMKYQSIVTVHQEIESTTLHKTAGSFMAGKEQSVPLSRATGSNQAKLAPL